MMEKIDKAIDMMMAEMRKKNGTEANIEEGEEIVGVFNDAVVIVGITDDEIKVSVSVGKPYTFNIDLGILS